MISPDFVVVVGLDREHLEELEVSLSTWQANQPGLFGRQWLFVCHPDLIGLHGTPLGLMRHLENIGRFDRGPLFLNLLEREAHGRTNREVMLSAMTLEVPRFLREAANLPDGEPPYWLKLDTDVLAAPSRRPFPDPAWFAGSPALIAPPWGYTKPASHITDLDRWSRGLPGFTHPVERKFADGRAFSRRIISYWCLQRTDWTVEMAELVGGGRLPAPSHDTFLWYCATRRGDSIRRVRTDAWKHVGSNQLHRLRRLAASLM